MGAIYDEWACCSRSLGKKNITHIIRTVTVTNISERIGKASVVIWACYELGGGAGWLAGEGGGRGEDTANGSVRERDARTTEERDGKIGLKIREKYQGRWRDRGCTGTCVLWEEQGQCGRGSTKDGGGR